MMGRIPTDGYKVFLKDVPVTCLAIEVKDSLLSLITGRALARVTYLDDEDRLHHVRMPLRQIEMIEKVRYPHGEDQTQERACAAGLG